MAGIRAYKLAEEFGIDRSEFVEKAAAVGVDALQRLPEPFRTTLILREMEGNTYEEVANILGISIRTLRNKLKLYSQDGVSVPASGLSDRAPA